MRDWFIWGASDAQSRLLSLCRCENAGGGFWTETHSETPRNNNRPLAGYRHLFSLWNYRKLKLEHFIYCLFVHLPGPPFVFLFSPNVSSLTTAVCVSVAVFSCIFISQRCSTIGAAAGSNCWLFRRTSSYLLVVLVHHPSKFLVPSSVACVAYRHRIPNMEVTVSNPNKVLRIDFVTE